MALVLLVWGMFVMGMAPSLQLRVVSLAGPGGALAPRCPPPRSTWASRSARPPAAWRSAASAASAAVLTGLIIAVIAIAVAWATSFLKPPAAEPAAAELTPYVA